MKTIKLVSGNENKLNEYRALLPNVRITPYPKELVEIQHLNIAEVAVAKLKTLIEEVGTKSPLLVEDTGLFIDYFNWQLPGAFTSQFLKVLGPKGILNLMQSAPDRRANIKTVLAYFNGTDIQTFSGTLVGSISMGLEGVENFGFDCIFVPRMYCRTLAQLGQEEKNRISSRAMACKQFLEYLNKK